MKHLLLFALLLSVSLQSTAQITVPASTFPMTNDVLRYVQAANPGVAVALYTPPGGNQFWDLSMLTAASTFETNYRPAAEGVNNAPFPNATMVVKSGLDEYYYTSTATQFQLLGHTTTTVGGLPLNAVYINSPVYAERHAPLHFFDIYQQSFNNVLKWAYSDIPAGAFPPQSFVDSVRLRFNTQVLEVVDAYGTLRLPGPAPQPEFSVLRLKKTIYQAGALDVHTSIGWIPVQQVLDPSSAWASLTGTDTTVTHHYLNDISKEEIAVLTFNNEQNAVTKVTYKNTAPVSSIFEIPDAVQLQCFPNPAVAAVTIRCANIAAGIYKLKIFSSLGTLVQENTDFFAANSPVQISLSDGLNGLYFCRLETTAGKIVGMSRLMVMQ
jgi:hypothetical protein